MVSTRISVTRLVAGRTLTIRNVPAFSCPRCDNVLYKASTVKTMDALIRENPGRDTLLYPADQDYGQEIVSRIAAGDPWFEDAEEPARRYDFACLESRFLRASRPAPR